MDDVVFKPLNPGIDKSFANKAEFVTWETLCLFYGRRITKTISTGLTNSARSIYDVPQGKIFLMITGTLSCMSEDTAVKDCRLWGGTTGVPVNDCTIIRIVLGRSDVAGGNQEKNQTVSVSPSVPLLYTAGESLFIANPDDDVETHGSITGYEIDADVFFKKLKVS